MVLIDNSATLTNGVTATLISASDGELLGIRVEWSIKSEFRGCEYRSLRVQLNELVSRDINATDRRAVFSKEQLDCNTQYTPTMIASVATAPDAVISRTDYGASLLYRGKNDAYFNVAASCF